jgi:hypothetical protein
MSSHGFRYSLKLLNETARETRVQGGLRFFGLKGGKHGKFRLPACFP